jgi:uncharacterized protein YjbI with pentapeptide repeats
MASTRTLTVLRRLDEKRRNQVFQFLRDARLLGVKKSRGDREEADPQETAADDGDPIAVFVGRNMSHINLSGAYLYGANLSGAYLYGANLSRALLYGANLSEAYLYEAMLREANLSGANMYGANLYGANLIGAYMHGANLSRANLMKANLSEANLSGTNLSNVKLLTCEQLRQAMQWEHAYRDEELACGASIPAAPKKKADV